MSEPDLKGLTCNEMVRKLQPSETPLVSVYQDGERLGFVPVRDFLGGGMFVIELPESVKTDREVVAGHGTVWYQLDVASLKPHRGEKLMGILGGLQSRGVCGNRQSISGNA